jgi:hypothetical protein
MSIKDFEMASWIEQRREAEAKIVAKAWADPSFKSELLRNPSDAVQRFLKDEGYIGANESYDLNIDVVQETPDRFVLVLPPNPDDVELSPEILDAIGASGGQTSSSC